MTVGLRKNLLIPIISIYNKLKVCGRSTLKLSIHHYALYTFVKIMGGKRKG